jgi:hypothetical protein
MISAEQLDAVLGQTAARINAPGGVEVLTTGLRSTFPGMHITVCGEDDIPARLSPAAENAVCLLYYVDASEHCLKLTTDAEAASGVAVALRGDDD